MRLLLHPLIAALALNAFATSRTDHMGTGGSSFEIRIKSDDQFLKAAVLTAGRSMSVTMSKEDSSTLRAARGLGLAAWEGALGVLAGLTTPDPHVHSAEVLSLKRLSAQLTGAAWASTFGYDNKAMLDL